MGKKRRILNRARKFASKYFQWMDKSDGTDDNILSDVPQYIDALTITDEQNQTVKIEGFALGPITAGGGGDEIDYSIDGAAYVNAGAIFTDNGVGETTQRYSFAIDPAPTAPGFVSVGDHKITVRMKDDTDALRYKNAKISVRENKIVIDETAFSDVGGSQIGLDIDNIFFEGATSAGSSTPATSVLNGWTITGVDSNGAAVTIDTTVADVDLADLAALSGSTEDVLDTPGADTYTLTVTPKDGGDNLLTASATTVTVPVA